MMHIGKITLLRDGGYVVVIICSSLSSLVAMRVVGPGVGVGVSCQHCLHQDTAACPTIWGCWDHQDLLLSDSKRK